jgi:hypothetical protein
LPPPLPPQCNLNAPIKTALTVDLQTIIGEVQTIKTGRKINLEVQTNLPITMEIETKMETIKVRTATRMPPVGTAKTMVTFKPDVSKGLQTENLLSPKTIKCF